MSKEHPCFSPNARTEFGRIHLPVAKTHNTRTRYEDPLYLASTDNRVEKAPVVMTPEDSINYLKSKLDVGAPISVAGITGPGDPFADATPTLKTLELLKTNFPHISRCVTTNGLGVAEHATSLASLVDHVTITVLGTTEEILEQLYAWVRPAKRNIPLSEGVKLLIESQKQAIIALKEAGITVKINTTLYPSINGRQIDAIAELVASLGADIMHVTAFQPPWEDGPALAPPTQAELERARKNASRHLPLMEAPSECGFMIVGKMGEGCGSGPEKITQTTGLAVPDAKRPYVAVASGDGIEVNLHLGHTRKMLIYGPNQGPISLLEAREMPAPGSGDNRWEAVAQTLSDCSYLLVSSAGARPRNVLQKSGLRVIQTEGEIDPLVESLYGTNPKKCKK